MPKTITPHPTSPGTGGMLITFEKATDFNGRDINAAIAPPVLLTVSPKTGATGTSRLTSAGMVAMVGAVNTHISGLSAANRDLIAGQLPGGLSVTITPTLVTVPSHASGVTTLAAALQAVLAVGANVAVISSVAP